MTEHVSSDVNRSPVYWPWFLAGLLSPVTARLLATWLPFHIAAALSFFVLFFMAASLVAAAVEPGRSTVVRNLASSAGGALILGLLAWLHPWQ